MATETPATGTAPAATETATSTAAAATLLGATETTTSQTSETPAAAALPSAATTETPATPAAETPEAKAAAAAATPEGAPEKYTFVAPEGKVYDANLVAALETGAREANLSQAAAQKLLDAMAPAIQTRQDEQVLAIKKGWYEASQTDKDFGGVALEQNLGIAKRALDTFGTPALSLLLNSTGLGNHPEVIRFMFKAGQAIAPDKFVTGTAPTSAGKSAAAVLYDNTK